MEARREEEEMDESGSLESICVDCRVGARVSVTITPEMALSVPEV